MDEAVRVVMVVRVMSPRSPQDVIERIIAGVKRLRENQKGGAAAAAGYIEIHQNVKSTSRS